MSRARIRVRRKASSICTFEKEFLRKIKRSLSLLRGEIPRGADVLGAVPCSASNVEAPTTGKVSKLYSGLRISRISIPYYTTYYLTQTSSRSAPPPSFLSLRVSAVLLLALNSPPDRLFDRSFRLISHSRSTHRANLSHV